MSHSETDPDILDVTPEVVELPGLMQRLRAGLLQVPRFQREFVWSDDDRTKLMLSIAQGIPIGSILTWHTTRAVPVFERMGPHIIPRPDSLRRPYAPTYVLDGHQRLTALFGALVRPEESEQARWSIYADLAQEQEPGGYRFVFHRSRRARPAHWFPLYMLFDDNAYLRFLRGIDAGDAARTEWLVDRTTRLVTLFRRYRIPLIPLVSEDFGLVTRTFVLINQAGTDMTEADLVNALFQTSEFNRDMAQLREEKLAPLGWGGLQDQWILDACKVAADVRLGRSDPDEIVNALKNDPFLFDLTGVRLVRVANFLQEHCAIPAPGLLPYEQFAALMTEFFRLCPTPDAARLSLLRRWFWVSVYQILATSFTFSAIKKALEKVREVATAVLPEVDTLDEIESPPAVTTTRSARTRALGLLLWRLGPLRSDGTRLEALTEFGETRGLFAIVGGGEPPTDKSRAQIGNRILADKRDLAALRRKLLDPSVALDTDFLASHAIPEAALAALRAGDAVRFVQLRTEHIVALERAFLQAEGVFVPPPDVGATG